MSSEDPMSSPSGRFNIYGAWSDVKWRDCDGADKYGDEEKSET